MKIKLIKVKCRSENPRTIGFYIIFSLLWCCVCHQSYKLEYYLSFRTIFFLNNAETDYVGHLDPRTFRSTWGIPKCPTVKFSSRLFFFFFIFFFLFIYYYYYYCYFFFFFKNFPPSLFNHFPLFTSILNVILRQKNCRTSRAVGYLRPLQTYLRICAPKQRLKLARAFAQSSQS